MASLHPAAKEDASNPDVTIQRLEEQQRVYLSAVVNLQVDSLVKDINRIRFAFLETRSVRFEQFAVIFRSLKATKLFQGFANELAARVFVEDLFEVLIREFEDSDSFTNNAFLVYMLYATYYVQINRPRVTIRLRCSDFERLESFIEVCQQDNHLDLVYAIRRLQTDSAFHFVHSLRPFAFKSYMLDPQHLTQRKLELANKIASHRNLLQTTDLFKRLEFVHDKYCELKESLSLTLPSEQTDSTNPFLEMRHKIRSMPTDRKNISEDDPEQTPQP